MRGLYYGAALVVGVGFAWLTLYSFEAAGLNTGGNEGVNLMPTSSTLLVHPIHLISVIASKLSSAWLFRKMLVWLEAWRAVFLSLLIGGFNVALFTLIESILWIPGGELPGALFLPLLALVYGPLYALLALPIVGPLSMLAGSLMRTADYYDRGSVYWSEHGAA